MVDHGSLILPLLATPGTVGIACISAEEHQRSWIPLSPHDLWEILW